MSFDVLLGRLKQLCCVYLTTLLPVLLTMRAAVTPVSELAVTVNSLISKTTFILCSLFLFFSSQTPAFFCVHSKQKQKESKISCKGEKGNAANLIENWAKQSTTNWKKVLKKQFLWILLSYLNCESVLWLINYN